MIEDTGHRRLAAAGYDLGDQHHTLLVLVDFRLGHRNQRVLRQPSRL
jgi:hypothetical protein